MQRSGANTCSCSGRRRYNSCTFQQILLDLLFVNFINFTLLLANFLFESGLYCLLSMAHFTQLVNCELMCIDDTTAVPVLHQISSLAVGDVHGLGSAEESAYMLERSQAHIFTPNEGILEQVPCSNTFMAVDL